MKTTYFMELSTSIVIYLVHKESYHYVFEKRYLWKKSDRLTAYYIVAVLQKK